MLRRSAFSMIELMIIIAIIGVLALVGIPAYEKYRLKANIGEGTSIISQYRKSIAIMWSTAGRLPTTGDVLPGGPVDLPYNKLITTGLPSSLESLLLHEVDNGIGIKMVFAEDLFPEYAANNRTIYLVSKTKNSNVMFECGNFTKNPASSEDIGFIDQSLLPSGCNYNGLVNWISNY